MKIFENTKIPVLAKALDAYSLRHKVISSNISNITTEGYHAQGVSFEEQLSGAIGGSQMEVTTTNPNHMQGGALHVGQASPVIVDSADDSGLPTDPEASGVNDVDIDKERRGIRQVAHTSIIRHHWKNGTVILEDRRLCRTDRSIEHR